MVHGGDTKCRRAKFGETRHLHDEMTILNLKHAAGAIAAVLVAFPADFTHAATLNRNLGIGSETVDRSTKVALPVVAIPLTNPSSAARPEIVAQAQKKVPPPSIASPAQAPTGAEVVGKLLAPRASDPDVPLPLPNLAEKSQAEAPLTGPQLYGRGEQGGGILGLRVPIPVDRGGSSGNTRSGVDR